MRTRHTFVATGLVALLALAGVTAAIAADPAGDPPPRIAFLANGIVPADALAAGPIAGQLGAPVFTTQPDTLSTPASDGLDAHNPELVIVLGGPVAIQDGVLAQVSAATGLPIQDPDTRPDSGIVRAAGEDRFETARIVAQLVGDYDPAYLGVDLKAEDSDLLDGKDSSAFLGKTQKAADSNLLDGKDASEFQPAGDYLPRWAKVAEDGTIEAQSGGISVVSAGTGDYYVNFGEDVSAKLVLVSLRYTNGGPSGSNITGEITTGVCGTVNVNCVVAGTDNVNHVFVNALDSSGGGEDKPFYVAVFP